MVCKIAVVGLGKMGLSHLAILNALKAFQVAAICDSSTLVGATLAKHCRIRYLSTFDAVLALDDLDGVVIATPSSSHHTMVQRALERGLHVFCEKPLTLTASQSDRLADEARRRDLVGQVGYHNRFVGTFAEASRLLQSGAIGRIIHATGEAQGPVVLKPAKATWRARSTEGGGCLFDYAAHPINLLNWYLGPAERCECAALNKVFSQEVDDTVQATLGFGGGVTGQVSVNWSDPSSRKMTTRIGIWGSRGRIIVDRQEIQVFLTGSQDHPEGYGPGWTVRNITELTAPVEFYLRGEEYTAQLEDFAAAMLDPGVPRRNDFFSAAQTDAAIELIRDVQPSSARTAQPVSKETLGFPRRFLRQRA